MAVLKPVSIRPDFKIEKNVPPAKRFVHRIYPFDVMEIGDSFYAHAHLTPLEKLRPAASYYGKRHNKKFSVYRVDGGFRCWRIK